MSAAALRYSVAVERDDDVRAMKNLAVLFQEGAEGVAADLPRALRLYERVVWEVGHEREMENLAGMLETGTDDVPANPVRAEEMRTRAREVHS